MRNQIKYALLLLFLCGSSMLAKSQSYYVRGYVFDKEDKQAMPGATVLVRNLKDSSQFVGSITDANGHFEVEVPGYDSILFRVSSIGYTTFELELSKKESRIDSLLVTLHVNSELLNEVKVETSVQDIRVKGDTLEYNADAYKTNPDATSEDLVKKLPGMTSDGNGIQHNGEDVKKVLVDGKPFFNDDPTATLRNLPAQMVSSVQVFDMQSEQAQFTGFMDGNETKTINLVTKKGMNVGQFGNVYTGIGPDGKYNGGFTFNHFNGGQRISVIGMTNNVNQQNFNISDIMSVLSNSGNQGGGPPRPGSGGMNFFSDQQNGLTTTHSVGLNYLDYWGKKISVSGSYFYNRTDNRSNSTIARNYFTSNNQQYNQNSDSRVINDNHRFNFKMEYFIDSMNKLTVTPSLVIQNVENNSLIDGSTLLPESNTFLNQSNALSNYSALGFRFSNEILFQHKFSKKGRTFSTAINTTIDRQKGDGSYKSSTTYTDTTINEILDQEYTKRGLGNNFSANFSYTEPLGRGQVLISYKPGFSFEESQKNTFDLRSSSPLELDSSLSNNFTYNYNVHAGNLSYRISNASSYFIIGSDFQTATLRIDEKLPGAIESSKTFLNILPSAVYNKKLNNSANFFARFTTAATAPAVQKMQNVIDLSNPLLVQMGNHELNQSYESKLTLRLMKRQPEKERHMFFILNAKYTNQYISNHTQFIQRDTSILGVNMSAGSQLVQPVNLDGYKSVSLFGVYGFPVKSIKSNLNFNGGYTLTHNPSLIDNQLNFALNNSIRTGVYLSSNISSALDFSLSLNGSFNSVSNTLQTSSNSTYFTTNGSVNVNYMPSTSFVLASDLNYTSYHGLSQGFDQNYFRWNASVGYKFLKSKSLELKVSVYDILNQNTNLSRTITETYTEDNYTQALRRYGLVTLTYKFRHFKAGATGPQEMQIPKGMPPPGNMPRPPQ